MPVILPKKVGPQATDVSALDAAAIADEIVRQDQALKARPEVVPPEQPEMDAASIADSIVDEDQAAVSKPIPGPLLGPGAIPPQVAREMAGVAGKVVKDVPKAIAQEGKTLLGGALGGTSRFFGTLDAYSKKLAKLGAKFGLGKEEDLRGGMFEVFSRNAGYWADRLNKEGLQLPVVKDIIAGLGSAPVDIMAIKLLGGLTSHGAIVGGAEGGLKGAVLGGVTGAATHGILGGLGRLPSATRVPAAFATFAALEPGGVEERVAAGATMAGLLIPGVKQKYTVRQFIENYPKLEAKIQDREARKIMEQAAPAVTEADAKQTGGWKKTLDLIVSGKAEEAPWWGRLKAEAEAKKSVAEPTKAEVKPAAKVEPVAEKAAEKPLPPSPPAEKATPKLRIEDGQMFSKVVAPDGSTAKVLRGQELDEWRRIRRLPPDKMEVEKESFLARLFPEKVAPAKKEGPPVEAEPKKPGALPERRADDNFRSLVEKVKAGHGSVDEINEVIDRIGNDQITRTPTRIMFDLMKQERTPQAFIDVDNLKETNDKTPGRYEAGDALLRKVAERLQEIPGVTVFRTGGDEFAVVPKDQDLGKLSVALRDAQADLDAAGAKFSFGMGPDRAAASVEMQLQKKGRKATVEPTRPTPTPPVVAPSAPEPIVPTPPVVPPISPPELLPGPPKVSRKTGQPVLAKAPISEVETKTLNESFSGIAADIGLDPKLYGQFLEDAQKNWRIRKEGQQLRREKGQPRFVSAEDAAKAPEEQLRAFLLGRKKRYDAETGKQVTRLGEEPESIESMETIGKEPAEGTEVKPSTRLSDPAKRVAEALKSMGTPEERADLDELLYSDKTPAKLAKEKGVSAETIRRRQKEVAEKAVKRGALLRKAIEDPKVYDEVLSGVEEIQKKIDRGESLTDDESVAHTVGRFLAESNPDEIISGAFFFPAWIDKAGADKFKNYLSVLRTVGKDSKRLVAEQLNMPFWDKDLDPIVDPMLGIEREHSRVTEKAYERARPWLELKRKNPEMFKKVNEALLDENAMEDYLSEVDLKSRLDADGLAGYKAARRAIGVVRGYSMMKMKESIGRHYRDARARTSDPLKLAQLKIDYDQDLRDIRSYFDIKGYVPQSRFGRYAVKLNDAQGHILSFATFDHEREAKIFSEQHPVGSSFTGATAKVTTPGVRPKVGPRDVAENRIIDLRQFRKNPSMFLDAMHSFPLVKGILAKQGKMDPDIMTIFDDIDKELLKFFGKGRMSRRENVSGWSQDVEKNLENFFVTFPQSIAKKYGRYAYEDAATNLPEAKRQQGRDLIDFFEGRSQWEGRGNQFLRRAIYDFYLGLKASFGIVNSAQRVTNTLPKLIAETGGKFGEASEIMWRAELREKGIFREWLRDRHGSVSDAIMRYDPKSQGLKLTADEKKALVRMATSGEIGAARQKEIIGRRMKRDVMSYLEKFGTWSEKSNRLHSSLAALDLAKRDGMAEPRQLYDRASRFTGETQYIYSKATRAKLMRGPKAPLFMFKSYMLNTYHLNKSLWGENKAAAATQTAILIAMGGLYGIPGGKFLVKKVIPAAMRAAGLIDKEDDLHREVMEWEKRFDSGLGKLLLHGLPALMKVDGDLVFGNAELFSLAPLSMVTSGQKFLRGLESAKGASWGERLLRVSPTIVKHWGRLFELWKGKGLPTDEYGRPRLTEEDLSSFPRELRPKLVEYWKQLPKREDVGAWEQLMYGLGFPTSTFRRFSEGVYEIKSQGKEAQQERGGFNRVIGKAFSSGFDQKTINRIMAKKSDGSWAFTPTLLKGNFNTLMGKIPAEKRNDILDTLKEAKEYTERMLRGLPEKERRSAMARYKGDARWGISYDSILTQIRKYLSGQEEE